MKKRLLGAFGWSMAIQAAFVQPICAQEVPAESDLDALLGPATDSAPAPAPAAAPAEAPAAAPAEAAPAASEPTPAPIAASEAAPADAATADVAATAAAPAAKGSKSRLTEEIVVTSQKREQSLQEVPSSVVAFSGAVLDAKGVSDVKDLQLVTPGLQYDSMASYSIIFIRGIGGDAFQAAVDSSVATYVDGLYLPFTFSAAQALGDVSQIEVLKGPQGTLYGRNAIAGAITVKLKEPTKDFNASVLQQFSNYNGIKTKLSAYGAVPFTGETLTYGGSFLYEQRDPFTQNFIDPEQRYHSYRNVGYRGALKYDPTDKLTFKASYSNLKSQDADSVATVLVQTAPAFQGTLTDHNVPHESGNANNVGAFARTKILAATLESRYVPWFNQKVLYGHTEAESTILFDYDSAPEPVLDISAVPNTARSNSVEMILTSNPENTPEWLEWLGGAYFENTVKTGRYPATVDVLATLVGLPLAGLPPFNGLSPLCTIFTQLGGDCTTNSDTNQNPLLRAGIASGTETTAKQLYGQLTARLTDQLSLVGGARIGTERTELQFSTLDGQLIIPQTGTTTPRVPLVSYRPQAKTFNSFTPNAGLNFKLTDSILLYYKYSEAFKSGNYNGLNINNPPVRVEPEAASGNELGFKSELLEDRTLKLNGAIFQTTVTNAQVQTLSLTSGGVTSLQNAAAYTVRGGEIEVNWFATDALVFSATGVYLSGKYDAFIGDGYTDSTGLYQRNLDFSGNTTVRTPKFTGTGSASYTFPAFWGLEGEIAGDVYYTTSFFYDPLNTLKQDSYFITNARVGLFDPRTNIRITAFGKNLNDAGFYTNAYRQDFGNTAIWGAARTFGFIVNWSYGK